jgi:hypothetical protein
MSRFWEENILLNKAGSREIHTQSAPQKLRSKLQLFTVLRPIQEFFTRMETSPLPVKGCKI